MHVLRQVKVSLIVFVIFWHPKVVSSKKGYSPNGLVPLGFVLVPTSLARFYPWLKSANGRDVTQWVIIDVNSIVFEWNFDSLTLIIDYRLSLNC